MASFMHKTLSFLTGATVAYGGYIYMADQITFNVSYSTYFYHA